MRRHDFKYEENSIRQVEMLLPKLKFSVRPTVIVQWLENFEENDVSHALDLLRIFEYIPFNEFMLRIDYLLKEIFKKIPKNERAIIYPYGKVGKSGTLVTYPLRNTIAYKNRQALAIKNKYISRNEEYNLITHDFQMIKRPHDFQHIIFLDDFIGSGKTFIKEYSNSDLQKWISDNGFNSIFILSSIIMDEGKNEILKKDNKIQIYSETRHKLFHSPLSPLHLFKNKYDIKRITKYYGNKIEVIRPPKSYLPFGYDNSEALVAFFHGTPNNTIPLIWGDSDWKPLFPRKSEIRMSESKKFKKEIVYYLSICDKLGIDIINGSSIIAIQPDIRDADYQKLNEQNHAVVALIYLKSLGLENVFICQMLGLTREELRLIYLEALNKGLVQKRSYELTSNALLILDNLKTLSKKDKIRNESKSNLEIKKYIYLPKTFNGMT
ncbi:phosphoribosyltransferase-like protein [Chryseobacterium cheonjiense]|uniref:Uncharacterized protein n=1 Tax=Chryseobacterium cheonjiense TaxID=2728845 RepID=A0A7Y0A976_9FLAO|nr:hypothetical protein [Chryseobacterium cheonjiense]NML58783.1 hypothetical protein [Chryseobacterium cheonjiense]